MKVDSYRCDASGCEQVRKLSNHWILVFEESDRLVISAWRDDLAAEAGVAHCCGSVCVLKAVAAYLGKLTNGKSDQ